MWISADSCRNTSSNQAEPHNTAASREMTCALARACAVISTAVRSPLPTSSANARRTRSLISSGRETDMRADYTSQSRLARQYCAGLDCVHPAGAHVEILRSILRSLPEYQLGDRHDSRIAQIAVRAGRARAAYLQRNPGVPLRQASQGLRRQAQQPDPRH